MKKSTKLDFSRTYSEIAATVKVASGWGAIAMVDALGFKGIWKRPSVDVARLAAKMETMCRVQTMWQELGDDGALPDFQHFAQAVSDTFIFGVVSKSRDLPAYFQYVPLFLTCHMVGELVRLGLTEEPFLSFRGCLAVGELWITDDVILGESVEAAASLYEQPLAATVVLTPEAVAAAEAGVKPELPINLPPSIMEPWYACQVPLHGGEAMKTYVVDALLDHYVDGNPMLGTYAERLLATFDMSNPEVRIKHTNTKEILTAKGAGERP